MYSGVNFETHQKYTEKKKKKVNMLFASSHVCPKNCVGLLTLAFVPHIHADKVREDK